MIRPGWYFSYFHLRKFHRLQIENMAKYLAGQMGYRRMLMASMHTLRLVVVKPNFMSPNVLLEHRLPSILKLLGRDGPASPVKVVSGFSLSVHSRDPLWYGPQLCWKWSVIPSGYFLSLFEGISSTFCVLGSFNVAVGQTSNCVYMKWTREQKEMLSAESFLADPGVLN